MTSMNKQAIVLMSDRAGRVQTPVDRQISVVRESAAACRGRALRRWLGSTIKPL
jgi:hypothetical protein